MAKKKKVFTPRPSIFPGKDPRTRIQGILTTTGGREFERQRRRLGALYTEITGLTIASVSDGDVVEFCARGDAATRAYLVAFGST